MKLLFKSHTIIFKLMIMVISFTSFKSFGQDSLNIKVSNIKKNNGKIIVEIYNSRTSWLKAPYRKMVLAANENVQTASFQVPYGRYAVTVYQDVNVNGETDMNFIGIPKEPVGFGNNYKPFGEPKFESASVEFKETSKLQEIKLYKVF